eukprot:gene10826-biopygen7172
MVGARRAGCGPERRGRGSTPPPPSSIVAGGVQDCQRWAAEIAWRERATSAAAGRLSVAAGINDTSLCG